MSKRIIEIETIHAGQSRPYADSVYEATISMYNIGTLTNNHGFYHNLNRKTVIKLAKMFVQNFDEDNTTLFWFEPKLVCCEPVGPTKEMIEKCTHPMWQPSKDSRWRVKVVVAFTD